MTNHPFIVRRSAFFSIDRLERIEEAALRILADVGIAILDEEILQRLKLSGFQGKGNRITIDRKLVREFLDAERTKNGNKFTEEPQPIDPSSHEIGVYVIEYAQWIHDIDNDSRYRM